MAQLLSKLKKVAPVALGSALILIWLYVTSREWFTADALMYLFILGGWFLSLYLYLKVLELRHQLAEARRKVENLCAGLEAVWPKLDEGVKVKLHNSWLGWADADAHEEQAGGTVSGTNPGGTSPG